MNFLRCLVTLSLFLFSDVNAKTPTEQEELEERISHFYDASHPKGAMQKIAPKYSVKTGQRVSPHPELKGKKTDPAFRKIYCEKVLKRRFPGISCADDPETWEGVKSDDRVEDLTQTWMSSVTYDLEALPVEGKSEQSLWSDDYWRTKWGLTSYRYANFESAHESMTYPQMIALYQQPQSFLNLLTLPAAEIEKQIISLSPSEKYDLTVGDETFSLTLQQKAEGKELANPQGDVEEWMGLCHGWAPASLMIPRPLKPVEVVGAKGHKVTWYPADLKALLTLQWSNANYDSNFVGGRCGDKKPKLFSNGRLSNPECFDNNPATFHYALGNLIGIAKGSFVMDRIFDYEVWNQPLVSYDLAYFNPLNPKQKSKKWSEVAVPYDAQFIARDRFQKPYTRGKNIEKVVGVIATVVYVSEFSPPEHSPDPEDDQLLRMSMVYDLELATEKGTMVATGGEWHENAHPDFLWVPHKATVPWLTVDKTKVQYQGTPSDALTVLARQGSAEAYPLCEVVKHLLDASTGTNAVQCLK